MSLNTEETLEETQNQACRNWTQQTTAWGRLCGKHINNDFKSMDLINQVFSVGRGKANDLILTLNLLPEHSLVNTSKVHFIIKRASYEPESPIYIQDVSRNGTFVNNEKIGLNKTRVLSDADVISLSLPTNNIFMFMDLRLPKELANMYYEVRELGCGAFGHVRLVIDTQTLQQFAMKIVKKKKMSGTRPRRDQSLNEVEIMKNLSHPCLVRMHVVVDRPEAVYMLLDPMSGDLLSRVHTNKYLSEEISKLYFYQMCLALKYIHDRDIIHRDLKLENILLATNDEETLLKLGDFGLSVQRNSLPDGTPTDGQKVCTKKVDIWSLGVVLFCCLSGTWPFCSTEDSPLAHQIKNGNFAFVAPEWKNVSQDAMFLIDEIFTVDPKTRPSIDDILQSNWLQDEPMVQKAKQIMTIESMESKTNILCKTRSYSI